MSSGQQTTTRWLTPGVPPLSEARWQAWLAKGRARDDRKVGERSKAIRYIVVAVLLLAAGIGSISEPYGMIIRFIVASGALFFMLQAFGSAHYAVGAVFGIAAVAYNPVVPAFSFTGDWQRGLMLGTALLFMVASYWPSGKVVHGGVRVA